MCIFIIPHRNHRTHRYFLKPPFPSVSSVSSVCLFITPHRNPRTHRYFLKPPFPSVSSVSSVCPFITPHRNHRTHRYFFLKPPFREFCEFRVTFYHPTQKPQNAQIFLFDATLSVSSVSSVCNYLLLPKNPSNRSICFWFCTGPRWKPSLMIITVGLPSAYSVQ